jgi:hypothetical protein
VGISLSSNPDYSRRIREAGYVQVIGLRNIKSLAAQRVLCETIDSTTVTDLLHTPIIVEE